MSLLPSDFYIWWLIVKDTWNGVVHLDEFNNGDTIYFSDVINYNFLVGYSSDNKTITEKPGVISAEDAVSPPNTVSSIITAVSDTKWLANMQNVCYIFTIVSTSIHQTFTTSAIYLFVKFVKTYAVLSTNIFPKSFVRNINFLTITYLVTLFFSPMHS